MGKKRIVKEAPTREAVGVPTQPEAGVGKEQTSRKHVDSGVLYVESTYNNTKLTLTDSKNNTLAWSSSGSLGFKGAKKGTPFAAAKVGEALALKAQTLGIKEVKVVVKGVGSGRESAIRGFISKGINLVTIQDKTAVPHNGPKPPKPRRT
ncbi:MAG: 30S ribosomal protein S11 [bacterium]|nr:30S ribosomal protein S11 [bacterium]